MRRRLVIAGMAVVFQGASVAFAQDFPSRPIRLIVPGSAATSVDAIARVIADPLSSRLKTPVVVDNRPGAGGLIAYTSVAKAAPDGYTLILSAAPLWTLPHFSEAQETFDALKDFTPIARIARTPNAVVVAADSPYRTMNELVAAMKARPGELTYSSQGSGSGPHLCASILQQATQATARHIPYKQTSNALTDVISGQITFTCIGTAGVAPLVHSGKVRALAVTADKRWSALADVPTVAEVGIKGFHVTPGVQLMGPARLPRGIVQQLSAALLEVASTPQFKEFLDKGGMEHFLQDANKLASVMPAEVELWKRISISARGSGGS